MEPSSSPATSPTPRSTSATGPYYLRYLLDLYNGNEVAALAAYNAGSRDVDDWGGAELGLDAIRFPETRAYVQEVLEKRLEYRDKYADDLGIR